MVTKGVIIKGIYCITNHNFFGMDAYTLGLSNDTMII
jgi:hypothetical protein